MYQIHSFYGITQMHTNYVKNCVGLKKFKYSAPNDEIKTTLFHGFRQIFLFTCVYLRKHNHEQL